MLGGGGVVKGGGYADNGGWCCADVISSRTGLVSRVEHSDGVHPSLAACLPACCLSAWLLGSCLCGGTLHGHSLRAPACAGAVRCAVQLRGTATLRAAVSGDWGPTLRRLRSQRVAESDPLLEYPIDSRRRRKEEEKQQEKEKETMPECVQ